MSSQSEEESNLSESLVTLNLDASSRDQQADLSTPDESAAAEAPTLPRRTRRKQPMPLSRAAALDLNITRLQMQSGFMIPRLSFGRLVRELLFEEASPEWRMTTPALETLQMATEMYMAQRFEDAYLLTLHRGRVTLEVRDLALINFILYKHGDL